MTERQLVNYTGGYPTATSGSAGTKCSNILNNFFGATPLNGLHVPFSFSSFWSPLDALRIVAHPPGPYVHGLGCLCIANTNPLIREALPAVAPLLWRPRIILLFCHIYKQWPIPAPRVVYRCSMISSNVELVDLVCGQDWIRPVTSCIVAPSPYSKPSMGPLRSDESRFLSYCPQMEI